MGGSATFSWSVSDTEGDTLTCLLDVDGDGSDDYTINDCANNSSQAHAYATSGDYTVRLTVGDGLNSVQQTLLLTVKSHLVLDVTANGAASADGRVLYDITVSNISVIPVNTVEVFLTVPAELSFHRSDDVEPDAPGCGTSCNDGDETYLALGTLASGESRTITINAPVLPGVLAGTLISAPIRVTSPDVIDNVIRTNVTSVSN